MCVIFVDSFVDKEGRERDREEIKKLPRTVSAKCVLTLNLHKDTGPSAGRGGC